MMRSQYGVLKLAGVRVEVMGDISKRNTDGSWGSPPDLAALIRWVDVGNLNLPAVSLEYKAEALLALEFEAEAHLKEGRLAEALLLRHLLDRHRGK
jgi:hypothetical protein